MNQTISITTLTFALFLFINNLTVAQVRPMIMPWEVYVSTINTSGSAVSFRATSQYSFMWRGNNDYPHSYEYMTDAGTDHKYFVSDLVADDNTYRAYGWDYNATISDGSVIRTGYYKIFPVGLENSVYFFLEYRSKYFSNGPGDLFFYYNGTTQRFYFDLGNQVVGNQISIGQVIYPPGDGDPTALTEPTTIQNSFGAGQIIYDGQPPVGSGSIANLNVNSNHTLTAINGQAVGHTTYRFESWSDGSLTLSDLIYISINDPARTFTAMFSTITAPQNVAISIYSSDGFAYPHVTWTASSEPDVINGGHILIERRTNPYGQGWTSWSQIATLAGTSSDYIDYGIKRACQGTCPDSVQYRLRSTDQNMLASPYSAVVSITAYGTQYSRLELLAQSVTTGEPSKGPERFESLTSYPNPANPSATLRYAIPIAGHVLLVVYNMLGQEVSRLVDCEQEAGYHGIVFGGAKLSSGVYYAKLLVVSERSADPFMSVTKILLEK